MSAKKSQAEVNSEISHNDLLKEERQRFQESKAPKMSELTSEDFRKTVASALGGAEVNVDYEKIRTIVREEIEAVMSQTDVAVDEQDEAGAATDEDAQEDGAAATEDSKRTRKASK